MRQSHLILDRGSVTQFAVHGLLAALQWTLAQTGVEPTLLVQLLVQAAASKRSLSAVVAAAVRAPCEETIRTAILKLLPPDPLSLIPLAARALHGRLPKSLARRPRAMAVDFHLRPYYGRKTTRGTFRGQPKAGTKNFFAYATLMVLRKGQTYTVGVTPVVNGEEQSATLARLLAQAKHAGLRVQYLLLDRGFYAASTIDWLQRESLPFLMPMIRRGKASSKKIHCTGTERFFVKGRRGWDTYTWTARPRRGGKKQAALEVTVDVCMAPANAGQRKRKRRKGPLVFVCHGLTGKPAAMAKTYRRRFGIETSYRQLGQCLAATCSTNASYRFLLVVIALVLRNEWVWLHDEMLSERSGSRGRGRRLRLEVLRLRVLTSWWVRELDRILQTRSSVVNYD